MLNNLYVVNFEYREFCFKRFVCSSIVSPNMFLEFSFISDTIFDMPFSFSFSFEFELFSMFILLEFLELVLLEFLELVLLEFLELELLFLFVSISLFSIEENLFSDSSNFIVCFIVSSDFVKDNIFVNYTIFG